MIYLDTLIAFIVVTMMYIGVYWDPWRDAFYNIEEYRMWDSNSWFGDTWHMFKWFAFYTGKAGVVIGFSYFWFRITGLWWVLIVMPVLMGVAGFAVWAKGEREALKQRGDATRDWPSRWVNLWGKVCDKIWRKV